MPQNSSPNPDDERAAIAAEAALIEKNANYASEAQFEASNLWRTVQLWFTVPAAVLAAIAGGTALTTTAGRLIAGSVALAAAALSAASAALGAPSRVAQHQSAGSGFLALRNAARVFRLVDLPLAPAADALAGRMTGPANATYQRLPAIRLFRFGQVHLYNLSLRRAAGGLLL